MSQYLLLAKIIQLNMWQKYQIWIFFVIVSYRRILIKNLNKELVMFAFWAHTTFRAAAL